MKEFKLKPSDLPLSMRDNQPTDYVNHVESNIKIIDNQNDINKVEYMSKIGYNVEKRIKHQQKKYEVDWKDIQQK